MKSVRPLVAHLMRRAGFGATPAELDTLTRDKTYEEIVDDLIHPERFPAIDTSLVDRYYGGELVAIHVGKWLYRMVNTQRPLEEKMALFLHHIFPVAWGKSEHGPLHLPADRHVPPRRHDGHAEHPARAVARPGHDLLARQQREPQERNQ